MAEQLESVMLNGIFLCLARGGRVLKLQVVGEGVAIRSSYSYASY